MKSKRKAKQIESEIKSSTKNKQLSTEQKKVKSAKQAAAKKEIDNILKLDSHSLPIKRDIN